MSNDPDYKWIDDSDDIEGLKRLIHYLIKTHNEDQTKLLRMEIRLNNITSHLMVLEHNDENRNEVLERRLPI